MERSSSTWSVWAERTLAHSTFSTRKSGGYESAGRILAVLVVAMLPAFQVFYSSGTTCS